MTDPPGMRMQGAFPLRWAGPAWVFAEKKLIAISSRHSRLKNARFTKSQLVDFVVTAEMAVFWGESNLSHGFLGRGNL